MIDGAHLIFHSTDPGADRAFLRDVLGFNHVDAGNGWLLFQLPPAEAGVHPADSPGQELYFMCDDLTVTMTQLTDKGVEFVDEPSEAGWGRVTRLRLPGGGLVGLYQPYHSRATEL